MRQESGRRRRGIKVAAMAGEPQRVVPDQEIPTMVFSSTTKRNKRPRDLQTCGSRYTVRHSRPSPRLLEFPRHNDIVTDPPGSALRLPQYLLLNGLPSAEYPEGTHQ
jgi:hypothetical protein